MPRFTHLLQLAAAACATFALGSPTGGLNSGKEISLEKRNGNQSVVSWDARSLFIDGERIHFYSGEFHPFRIPVPGLWLDVFQKIKALGYNGASFYVDWALIEGTPGTIRDGGIFALQPFFDAALQAGIYLLARPGPYINAEVSGGGFPGWLQGIQGQLRTNMTAFENAYALYVNTVVGEIAKAQITNGGPVIMVQVENEYNPGASNIVFPDYKYIMDLERQFMDAGIILPLTNNEAGADGRLAPGTRAQVDIYGYDGYPLGFNCRTPYTWGSTSLPTNFWSVHEQQDPSAPHFIAEFQAGSFDPWGGYGFEMCTALLGPEFERLFYKNNIASDVTMQNLYMTYGGTNWGNLGHPGGYTSYDYGAAIKEDRTIARQKYSEAKLIANFVQASPALLTAIPGTYATSAYTKTGSIVVTALTQTGETNAVTKFFVARQAVYNSLSTSTYTLSLPTSKGNITVPQLGGNLTIIGRDSKIHVVDYSIGTRNVLYSTAEVASWGSSSTKTVLIVYGEISETHEMAFTGTPSTLLLEDSGITTKVINKNTVINWQVKQSRNVLKLGDNIFVYMVPRQQAYEWWVTPISADGIKTPSSADDYTSMIASGPYLIRNATLTGKHLSIRGDLNQTVPLEIAFGAPKNLQTLSWNGQSIAFTQDSFSTVKATLNFTAPTISLPDLSAVSWKYHDGLPEIQSTYDDSAWPLANKNHTADIDVTLRTPTSLVSSDYGFHSGSLLFRGHFTANGMESNTTSSINVQGGSAFGFNLWLNSTLVATYVGSGSVASEQVNFTLPHLTAGSNYVLTLLQDLTGYDENGNAGDSGMKNPRGILSYSIAGHNASDVAWKITGNLGGQNYQDLTRGPLNEGSMYPERQGYHLPAPPTSNWSTSSPLTGISTSGVAFYSTSFNLSISSGYDVPLSFVFTAAHNPSPNFRVQLFVNGYQYGKYVNNIGPQTVFPVHEGILNHRGMNYVAMTLWAQDAQGAKLGGLALQADAVVQTGYGDVVGSPQPVWTQRVGAY